MPFRLATLAARACRRRAARADAEPQRSPDADAPSTRRSIEGVERPRGHARAAAAEIRRGDISRSSATCCATTASSAALEGEGGVRLQSGADRFFGPRLQYNTLDDTGVFESPSFLLQRERTGARQRRAHRVPRHATSYRLINAHYTTCQPGQDDWFLEAQRARPRLRRRTRARATQPAAALLRRADPRLRRRRVPAREPAAQRPADAVLLADQHSAASSSAAVLLEHRAGARRHAHAGVHGAGAASS